MTQLPHCYGKRFEPEDPQCVGGYDAGHDSPTRGSTRAACIFKDGCRVQTFNTVPADQLVRRIPAATTATGPAPTAPASSYPPYRQQATPTSSSPNPSYGTTSSAPYYRNPEHAASPYGHRWGPSHDQRIWTPPPMPTLSPNASPQDVQRYHQQVHEVQRETYWQLQFWAWRQQMEHGQMPFVPPGAQGEQNPANPMMNPWLNPAMANPSMMHPMGMLPGMMPGMPAPMYPGMFGFPVNQAPIQFMPTSFAVPSYLSVLEDRKGGFWPAIGREFLRGLIKAGGQVLSHGADHFVLGIGR